MCAPCACASLMASTQASLEQSKDIRKWHGVEGVRSRNEYGQPGERFWCKPKMGECTSFGEAGR